MDATQQHVTTRATEAEKASAWERLMQSTKQSTDDALMDAWSWLKETVTARELDES